MRKCVAQVHKSYIEFGSSLELHLRIEFLQQLPEGVITRDITDWEKRAYRRKVDVCARWNANWLRAGELAEKDAQ